MRVLEIEKIDKFGCCLLVDLMNKKQYEIVLDFYNTTKPKIKDKILIAESLIDNRSPFFSKSLYFEPSNDFEVSNLENFYTKDYIALERDNKTFLMRRIYG